MASSSSSSSSQLPPAVTVLETCWVAPSREGLPPIGEEGASLPLTFFDVHWVGTQPVERLFFYRWHDADTPRLLHSVLPRLTRALSLTLRHYYPLAGRLRAVPPGSDAFEIYCTDSDSVPLTLAESDGDFLRLAGDQPRGLHELRPLVAQIPGAAEGGAHSPQPLMALQVTVFPGAGVCVGFSIHHPACDGSVSTRFVKAWAAACCSPPEEDVAWVPPDGELPVVDRTLVSAPKGLYTIVRDGMKSLAAESLSFPKYDGPDAVLSTFLLRRADIEKLRCWVPSPPPSGTRYSSFVLAVAHVWVCLLRAGELGTTTPGAAAGDDAAHLFFTVDFRARLRPPLPAAYLGNCLGTCFVDAPRGELVGEGGVGRAAEAIAGSVARLRGEEDVLWDAERWVGKVKEILQAGWPLSIAGSPRFGVYAVDFGWGRPAKVEVVGIERTGAIALADSRHEEGGIEVGLALPAPVMTQFASLFHAGPQDTRTEPDNNN